ncbi:hypothetical protein QTO31_13245 [Chloroflexus sp. MS-CIW-1]|uniref:hypothetical protein n=1 Tax=Chloroflexus sp. MS-CIW-1 TaxID=3055768 RepID=UPI0026485BA0|nr:hypothetical protein [Chloroflexus sp. MS-CIW-1]MDN5272936.1 hypothetical protein [Chloroflexus sp. MS-CIW-1]
MLTNVMLTNVMLTMAYTRHRAAIRWLLIDAVQRAWLHHQTIALLYQRLAARTPDKQHANLLAQMATAKVRQQQRYEQMLLRLKAPLPQTECSLLDRFLLWLLPCCGLAITLRWAEWIEQRDMQAILNAALILRSYRRPYRL